MSTPSVPLELIAYRLYRSQSLRLVAAPVQREFLAATNARFALRCLPMLLANQVGWFLVNHQPVVATWNGGNEIDDLTVSSPSGVPPAASHFGHGILTWHVPYLFRTPPGYNLWARGPVNWPKDGASPLEGLVETDWSPATFTMNWKITRPGVGISFDAGEPICQILPLRRGELNQFTPVMRPIESDPATHEGYRAWAQRRARFLHELPIPDSEAAGQLWERHYFQGITADGVRGVPDHETRLTLREFEIDDGTPSGDER
jgi:hypothetical protein